MIRAKERHRGDEPLVASHLDDLFIGWIPEAEIGVVDHDMSAIETDGRVAFAWRHIFALADAEHR
jgi:hypothetical protein